MPYKDRDQQLRYMRLYMRLKRAEKRLSRLKQRRIELQKIWAEDLAARIVDEGLSNKINSQIIEYKQKVEHIQQRLSPLA